MQPLTEQGRKTLFAIAAFVCAIPVVVAPLAGRSARQLMPNSAAASDSFKLRSVRTPAPRAYVRITRDPFVPDKPINARGSAPPNAPGNLAQRCTEPIVRGVAIGQRAQAIVACGGRIELISAGDRLNGSQVINITSSGVVLSGGTVLPLLEDSPR